MARILILVVLFLVVGCGDNAVAPDILKNVTFGSVEVTDDVAFIGWNRECGNPGDGWMLIPPRLQPGGCEPYYYIIEDGKGVICGPADCASTQELNAMFMYLIALIQHGEWVPAEG